jgi:type IV secretory pathway TrbD component
VETPSVGDTNTYILSRVWVTIDGFGLVIWFVEHLLIVTTSAIADSHTLQFTTARIKSFESAVSSPVVAW